MIEIVSFWFDNHCLNLKGLQWGVVKRMDLLSIFVYYKMN